MANVIRRIQSTFCGLNRLAVVGKCGSRGRAFYYTYSLEPSHIVDNKPEWVCDFQDCVKCIKSGDTVYVQGAAATPFHLVEAMVEHGKSNCLKDITVCHMHTEGPAGYSEPGSEGIFRGVSFFMAGNIRKGVNEGRADCIPIFLQDIPSLFHRKIIKPDFAFIQVSPPDVHGFCSLGTSVDCVRAGMTYAKTVVAQVNACMPRTFGDSIVHISHIDIAIAHDNPIVAHAAAKPSEEEIGVGKYIAEELVEDGATLQLGIGSLPDAVLQALMGHKDLGIHTEMFADSVIPLIECGAVTNNKKTLHRGRVVSSFLLGSEKLYAFVDNNPLVEMLEVDYTNNVGLISKHPKMTAINSAIEVDLTGQVCADSIGTRMYSGFGGQVDFIRGAAEGFDGRGKPIIALPSITKKGDSKIVPMLKPGAGVVTTRAHVHYIVTEHGIANLFGKSLRQRAHALICIADPKHQEALEKAAFERLKTMPSP